MAWTIGGGSGGGGGFTLGPQQNVFTGTDKADAEQARNDYAIANAPWLQSYNDDVNLNIRLEYDNIGNEPVAEYQVRNAAGTAWLTNSSVVAIKGNDGSVSGSGADFGFMDYNNTLAQFPPVSNAWNKLVNNGLGANTLKTFKPIGVSELLNTDLSGGLPTSDNGRFLFDDLSLGDQVTIRHTLSITPNSNGQTFQLRHWVGQSGQEYSLPMGVPSKMEQGGGTSTGDFTIEATVYIGDENTRLGGAITQITISGNCTVNYKGCYIGVIKRGVI